jgi:hypothetical protein
MRHLLTGTLLLVLSPALTFAGPPQDRDDHKDRDEHHDNGKHKGWDQHDDRGERGDRHDNGKHYGGDNAHNPHYRDWDDDHDRMRPGHPYPYGRYEHVKGEFIARRIDFRTRRVELYDNSNWVVASYDLERCRDWQWDRDRVYVYDDDHHPGWYLLFNARLGRYVHVEFNGTR